MSDVQCGSDLCTNFHGQVGVRLRDCIVGCFIDWCNGWSVAIWFAVMAMVVGTGKHCAAIFLALF